MNTETLYTIIASAKEVMFLVVLACLFVCLSVRLFLCQQHYPKTYERIVMKFYVEVRGGKRTRD